MSPESLEGELREHTDRLMKGALGERFNVTRIKKTGWVLETAVEASYARVRWCERIVVALS